MNNTEPFYEHMDDITIESKPATREELVEVLRTALKRAVVQEELDYELRKRIRDILKRER